MTNEMSPVEEIREAARLMREQAREEWHEAVADWLDYTATVRDHSATAWAAFNHAGLVARAYLGGVS